MRFYRNLSVVAACVLVLGLFAWAQGRKAGLWEVTSEMTWQQSPFPAGMPSMGNHGPMGGPHTSQVCLTQQQLDKYGTIPPQTRGDCKVTNVDKKADGVTAEMECTGAMQGKGTMQATWADDSHTSSTVHFIGEMQMGPNPHPVEWTMHSRSVYKGADCGSVKPLVVN